MITLTQVKKNPRISEFISRTEVVLAKLSYTDHGFRHANLVSTRARKIAQELGLPKKEEEMAAVAAYCHDMANFMSRSHHNYFGALLFHQVFQNESDPKELVTIMQAITNHDKKAEDMSFESPVSAIVLLADKSDVHRSRVTVKIMKEIKADIHDRVNYATKMSRVEVDKKKKRITLRLKIDTNFVPILEYFEIFVQRMGFCRKAAKFLDYDFGLIINKFRLL